MAHAHDAAGDHMHHSADDEYRETPDSSYEHTDANVWLIAKFGIWLLIVAVVVHVGLGLMFQMFIERSKEDAASQRYPLAVAGEPRLPPQPRLQQFPANEIYEFRLGERQRLTSYGWIDKEAGVVHIPIRDAMRLTLERGLLESRPADGASVPEVTGLYPSDASSGRVMERRRQ